MYRVDDLDASLRDMEARGWTRESSFEIPHGPCCSFTTPGRQRVALYELTRRARPATSTAAAISDSAYWMIQPPSTNVVVPVM